MKKRIKNAIGKSYRLITNDKYELKNFIELKYNAPWNLREKKLKEREQADEEESENGKQDEMKK